MQLTIKTLVAVAAIGVATQAAAQVTFYDGDGFRGRAFSVDRAIPNFDPLGYNDRAKSAVDYIISKGIAKTRITSRG